MSFNPNEVVFEKIRYIEEFDPSDKRLLSRLTNVKEPSLNLTSEGTQVTDAQGAEIVTFYNAAQGQLSYTNAIHLKRILHRNLRKLLFLYLKFLRL